MAPALLTLFAFLACARTGAYKRGDQSTKESFNSNEARASVQASLLSGCLYEGRWHASGATVVTRETCLRCVCVRSALSCRRRACAPIMEPPPKRCHVRHRRESCCPELICPDGIVKREQAAHAARFEMDDFEDIDTPNTVGLGLPACVEGGTVYAAGSAMSSNVACEQCFCLKGARKCVRPTCLPPPPHCVPRPTAGACCPQRYYCEYDSETVKGHPFDCEVDGKRIAEGERVVTDSNCTACFCLKGAVRCQELGCAPPLQGCQPVLRPGQCCAHQYKCEHNTTPTLYRGTMSHYRHPVSYNSLAATRNDDRALHMQKWPKVIETTTKKIIPDLYTSENTPTASTTTNDLIYTIKVKRKTNELPNDKSFDSTLFTSQKTITSDTTVSADEKITEPTEQPEGTVKIVINGTVNCTAELSSTSLPLSIARNDTDQTHDILPRIPIINGLEAQTYSPNDIITDSSVLGDYDENETFTINVTSSLNANTNSTPRPVITNSSMKPIPVDVIKTLNNSTKTNDYDYDYTEPTLPPSLPNLKIIPFVAADAVLDDLSKGTHPYPILERDDQYPIYYTKESKDSTFTRREEIYHPTQYPVFSEKDNDYDMDLTSDRFPVSNLEYTVSTDLKNHKNEEEAVTKSSTTSSAYDKLTPAVNLFSPPVETEGGFIPKGPGINDNYYAVYPSTPSAAAVPHLTTSMQLDIPKGDCTAEDGTRIPEGDSISIECSDCVCTWGQLRCAPTLCRPPPGCTFKEPEPGSVNQCCGDIVCKTENKTATVAPVTEKVKVERPKIEIATKNDSHDNSLQSLQFNNTTQQGHLVSSTLSTTTKQTHNASIEKAVPTSRTPFTESTTQAFNNNGSTPNTTTVTLSSTPKSTTTVTNSVPLTNSFEANDTSSEYEDEDDMGFSFGSVLKLLLSDNYDSTTKSPNNKPSPTKPPVKSSPPVITSTRRPPSTVNPFIPLPSLPFNPPKIVPSTVNRIDHLVLGEATAIKRTTTKRPTEKSTERPNIELAVSPESRPPSFSGTPGFSTPGARPSSFSGSPASSSPGVGSGLLKLAGCNIYGRIYRVGRIIAELSTPCLECWCIEIGVECKKLEC